MIDATVIRISAAVLLAALLFLCGELFKRMGLGRHWVPAVLGVVGMALGVAFGLLEGMGVASALNAGLPEGLMGAALSVYIHQICRQADRRDGAQIPFKGFYFDKRGEGR